MSKRDKPTLNPETLSEEAESGTIMDDTGNLDTILDSVIDDAPEASNLPDNLLNQNAPNTDAGATAPVSPPAASSMPLIPGGNADAKRGRGRPPLSQAEKDAKKLAKQMGQKPDLQGLAKSLAAPSNPETSAIEPAANICTMLIGTTGVMLGGEDAAMNAHEALLIKGGFVEYFKAKGVANVPPWVILTGALAPYYIRITTQTPARATFSLFVSKIGKGIKAIFGKVKNARSNSRDNVKRENDTSPATAN